MVFVGKWVSMMKDLTHVGLQMKEDLKKKRPMLEFKVSTYKFKVSTY